MRSLNHFESRLGPCSRCSNFILPFQSSISLPCRASGVLRPPALSHPALSLACLRRRVVKRR
jgi:hypothetical protein